MKPSDLHGIFPPITTPFVDGKVAYDKLAANIEKWNKTGLSGYVAFGSNGEYVYLDDEEKLDVVKTVVQSAASGKKSSPGRAASRPGRPSSSPTRAPGSAPMPPWW